jgi:hypothetical protein
MTIVLKDNASLEYLIKNTIMLEHGRVKNKSLSSIKEFIYPTALTSQE